MSLPKSDVIQIFLQEKLRREKSEKVSLLWKDNTLNEPDKPVQNRNKNEKKKRNPAFVTFPGSVVTDDSEKMLSYELDFSANEADPEAVKNRLTEQLIKSSCLKNISNYGGTLDVDIQCVEALSSYGISSVNNDVKLTRVTHEQSKLHEGSSKKSAQSKKTVSEQEQLMSGQHYSQSGEACCSSTQRTQNFRRFSICSESDHCHEFSEKREERDERNRRKAMKKLMVATVLSFLFMIGEIIGGYLASSLAVMTDAAHLLTDVSSFLISILALKIASRPISKKMTFGWHRAEVVGAIISVLMIWIITGVLVYLAIMRVVTNKYNVNGKNMLITAGLAVAFNIVMGLVLHEHGNRHGHNHSHDSVNDSEAGGEEESHSHGNNRDSRNVNVRAAFIHVLGDLLQSIGVLVAALIIYFKPEYKIADPICTFLFSVFVLFTTITILRDTVIVIMEGSPINIEYNVVKDKLLEVDGTVAVHDLRLWSLTLNQTVMSAHLVINASANSTVILKKATKELKSLYDFHSLTLQVEYYSDDMDSCSRCKPA